MNRTRSRALFTAIGAMAAVVVASNILVQHPVQGRLGGIDLANLLTWGAFTYPFAYLVSEIVNRSFGPMHARKVVFAGFGVAIVMSVILASPRVAASSGTAFLTSQMFDVTMFDRLRNGTWWRAPLAASVTASALDTALFFTLAFSALVPWGGDAFAVETQPLLGLAGLPDAPRWMSWAVADFAVKLLVAAFALGPYRFAVSRAR